MKHLISLNPLNFRPLQAADEGSCVIIGGDVSTGFEMNYAGKKVSKKE